MLQGYCRDGCVKKFCSSLREHAKNVNKKRAKITSRCKSILKLWKKHSEKKGSQKNSLKIKIMEQLETIAILLVNKEVQHVVYII